MDYKYLNSQKLESDIQFTIVHDDCDTTMANSNLNIASSQSHGTKDLEKKSTMCERGLKVDARDKIINSHPYYMKKEDNYSANDMMHNNESKEHNTIPLIPLTNTTSSKNKFAKVRK